MKRIAFLALLSAFLAAPLVEATHPTRTRIVVQQTIVQPFVPAERVLVERSYVPAYAPADVVVLEQFRAIGHACYGSASAVLRSFRSFDRVREVREVQRFRSRIVVR